MGDLRHEHGRQTEVILYYRGPEHAWPGKRPSDVVYAPRTGNRHHPTEKPVDLMRQVVSWTAGRVVDPFMGSGSTLVAAALAGQQAVGIELDQEYFETACRRVTEAIADRSGRE